MWMLTLICEPVERMAGIRERGEGIQKRKYIEIKKEWLYNPLGGLCSLF